MSAGDGTPAASSEHQGAAEADGKEPSASVAIAAGAARRRSPSKGHSRPALGASLAEFIVSPAFQCAAQLTIGMFIVCLFTFVNAMRFLQSCMAATLFIVSSILVSQDNHVGTKLLGCAMVCGAMLWGASIGGCALSFARLADPGGGHTAFICCLSAALLAVLVVNRMGTTPPFLWVLGMVSCLAYGLVVILGQFYLDRGLMWRQVVGYNLLAMAIGVGVAAVMAVTVLPSLAANELRAKVAEAVRGIGQSTSRYAAIAFKPEDPSNAFCRRPGANRAQQKVPTTPAPAPAAANLDAAAKDTAEPARRSKSSSSSSSSSSAASRSPAGAEEEEEEVGAGEAAAEVMFEAEGEDMDDDAYLAMLEKQTAPPPRPPSVRMAPPPAGGPGGPNKPAPPGGGGPPVVALRPLLARARMCIGTAGLEPPFLMASPFSPPAWGRVIGAAEELLARVATLECVLASGTQIAADASLECYFTVDIVPSFRAAYAHVATTCATLADAMDAGRRGQQARVRGCSAAFGTSWADTKAGLRGAMRDAFAGYWHRVRSTGGTRIQIIEAHRMRGLAFLWQVTNGIIDAMEALERATAAAHGIHLPPPAPPPQHQHHQHHQCQQQAAPHPAPAAGAAGAAPPAPPAAHVQPGPVGEATEPAAPPPPQQPAGGPPPGDGGAGGSPPPPPTWFQRNCMWAVMLILVGLGLPLVGNLVHTLKAELPLLRTAAGRKALLSSRVFQAGVKYWCVLVTVLLLILGLAERQDTSEVRLYRPVFGFVAAVLSMSERVEATMSKIALWIVGTAVGGTIGFLAMLDTSLAANPYGLMAIICAYTFMVGSTSLMHYRVGIVMTLMTLTGIVLCQYKGCCGANGSAKVYGARVLAVALGTSVPALVSNLVLPWYTSDWALGMMGRCFKAAAQLARCNYATFYDDGLRAHAAARGEEATRQLCERHGAPATPMRDAGPAAPHAAHVAGVPQHAGPPPTPLQALVAGPLAGVQVSLVKDTVLWSRGLLATPPAVPALLRSSLLLVDRLAALGLVSLAPPTVAGGFTGWAFAHIVVPLHGEMMAIFDALAALADATATHLERLGGCREKGAAASAAAAVAGAVDELNRRRLKIRNHVLALRKDFHATVHGAHQDDLPHLTAPDDALRVFAFIFALIQVADKSTALARQALGYRACGNRWLGRAIEDWAR